MCISMNPALWRLGPPALSITPTCAVTSARSPTPAGARWCSACGRACRRPISCSVRCAGSRPCTARISATGGHSMSDDEILNVIAQCIDEARPGIQSDGGDIELLGVKGQRVEIKLTGKCLTCGLAGQTLGAIRKTIMQRTDRPLMVVPVMA
ncbi:hypothetical protein GJ654_16950 [Rhodoblastus acidophilus]|uniref:NIF system FeS cluster assembly NifU C-terminal domain-containing protein n=2 Tax=Rhodoblastus acidophilus TaxID=1074 RepID=A0A6N8DT14_RHOAC|nr:hypothetical protein [Rhodoblastus acidophilus]